MEQLPDDVLAMVMQHLTVHDLLACRLVSTRIGALALHPDAWRHRRLGFSSAADFDTNFDDSRCLCPVLRLAPCVAVLARYLTHRRLPCRLADDTSMVCAAEEIWINLRKGTSPEVFGLIRRQGALGRLKVISMHVFGAAPIAAALEAAVSVPGLRGLEVKASRIPRPAGRGEELDVFPALATPALHALRHLTCSLCPKSEPFVNAVLAEHAATLERVHLTQRPMCMSLTATAPLLAAMPRLRDLACNNLPGLEAVAACGALRTLCLTVSSESEHRAAAAGAAELLRRAEHLRDVTLAYWPVASSPAAVGVDLVLALARPRRSRLEKLSIVNSTLDRRSLVLDKSPLLQPLLRTLTSLPALQHLSAQVDPDELLLAINPATTPALQSVTVTLPNEECAHAWLHGDAVKAALQANPSLHIELSVLSAFCSTARRPSCERACALGCHEELHESVRPGSILKYLGLFSHEPELKCSHIHKTGRQRQRLWVHIS